MAATNYMPESGGPLPGPKALTMLFGLHKIVHFCLRGKEGVHPGTMWSFTQLNRLQRAPVFFRKTRESTETLWKENEEQTNTGSLHTKIKWTLDFTQARLKCSHINAKTKKKSKVGQSLKDKDTYRARRVYCYSPEQVGSWLFWVSSLTFNLNLSQMDACRKLFWVPEHLTEMREAGSYRMLSNTSIRHI